MRTTLVLAALFVAGCGEIPMVQPVPDAGVAVPFELPNEIIVKFKSGYSTSVARAFHAHYGARHVSSIEQIGYHLFRLDPGIEPNKALEAIQADPRVEVAHFNHLYRLPPLPDTGR